MNTKSIIASIVTSILTSFIVGSTVFSHQPKTNCHGFMTYEFEDFDKGWGAWTAGGSDASLDLGYSDFCNSGRGCVRLRDNSGVSSSIYSEAKDLSKVSIAKVSFSFFPVSMDPGEQLILEASTNGGKNFLSMQEWTLGAEMRNNTRYEVTSLLEDKLLSKHTIIRIRCHGSSNNDRVFIDDLNLETCNRYEEKLTSLEKYENPTNIVYGSSLWLYPNPAVDNLHLELHDGAESAMTKVSILSHFGEIIKTYDLENTVCAKISVTDIPSGESYLIMVSNEAGDSFIEKFNKA